MTFELPYPPSVNTYWRRVGDRTLISRKGRQYRTAVVAEIWRQHAKQGHLTMCILAHPPDKRERDLDNILKALLDALEHGGAYENDSQIKRIEIEWDDVVRGGKVIVELTKYVRRMQRGETR